MGNSISQYRARIGTFCKKENIYTIKKNKIKFRPLNQKIFYRSYTTVLNVKGEMILGMANMDNYEKSNNFDKFLNFRKKIIIFDLNFAYNNIKSLILKYYLFNTICVCGTSGHKVYKVKNLSHINNTCNSTNLANLPSWARGNNHYIFVLKQE